MSLAITPGVVLKSIDQDEDEKGFRTSYTYAGTRAECEAQRIIERARGAKALSLRPAGDGNWELITTFPFNAEDDPGNADPATETHDLDVTMTQQDVWINPKLNTPADGGLGQTNVETLKTIVDRYKRGEFRTPNEAKTTLSNATINDGVPDLATARARMISYFELIALKQVDSWIFYRYVYSRTITSATPHQVRASHEGVQKLWTTAQLLAWENLPNDWWFTLPPMKWHKSPPRVATNIGQSSKTQISYNYIGSDEASALLYYAN